MFTPDQLYQKLVADPLSLGLAALLAIPDYVGVANMINAVGSTDAFLVPSSTVTVEQLLGAFTSADSATLATNAGHLAYISTAAVSGSIDATQTMGWSNLLSVLSGYTASAAALTRVGKRYGSAMEVWFGPGTVAQISDVVAAVNAK